MKISIVVPVYNTKKYLTQCIESILSQEIMDREVILVDDGSTDGSGEVCDWYAEKYKGVISIHQTNKGLSGARNTGIEAASGEYIVFIDSDDILLPDSLNRVVNLISGEDLIVTDYIEFYDNENNMPWIQQPILTEKEYQNGQQYLRDVLEKDHMYNWYIWFYVIRKAVFDEHQLYFKPGIKYEDVEFTYRMILKCNKVKHINRVMVGYRKRREGAITYTLNIKTEEDKLMIAEKNINNIKNMSLSEPLKILLTNNMSYLFYSAMISAYMFKNEERNQLLISLKEKQWICHYTKFGKQLIVKQIIKIFGVSRTSYLLFLRYKIARRI